VQGYLQSVSTDGQLTVLITEVLNGDLSSGTLTANIKQSKWDQLYPGLRRFRSQKWLMTLEKDKDTGIYELRSAYGSGAEQNDTTFFSTPTPLAVAPSAAHEEHSRATFGDYEIELVELTNQERWDNGMLPPFKQVDLLHNSSEGHSESMAINDFFAHCDLDSHTHPNDRMQTAGYSYSSWAENIAAGYGTPSAVISGWMSSPGHRANILNASRREIGVGYEYSGDQNADRFDENGDCTQDNNGGPYYNYWTQNFGSRSGVYPVVIERELAETSNQTVDLYIYGSGIASSMRFSNDETNWSSWVDYTPDYSWTLSSGGGLKTIYSQISTGPDGSGTVYNASDQIQFISNCDPMVFSNETLNGSQTYTSCEIIADPNVLISGEIVFQAGTVTLGENVEVPVSATLEVQIQ
jgi:uncharacterized protein YkwD